MKRSCIAALLLTVCAIGCTNKSPAKPQPPCPPLEVFTGGEQSGWDLAPSVKYTAVQRKGAVHVRATGAMAPGTEYRLFKTQLTVFPPEIVLRSMNPKRDAATTRPRRGIYDICGSFAASEPVTEVKV